MIEQGNAITRRDPQIRRAPSAAGLYDVLDLILDKGIVIDAFVRVSLVGIELVTIDARVVIASVDTYLRYAEGAERLQLYNRSQSERIPDFIEHQSKRGTATKLADKGMETAERVFGDGHEGRGEQNEQEEEGVGGKLAKGVKNVVGRLVHSVTGSEQDEGEEPREHQERRPQKQHAPERQRGNGHGGKPMRAGARR
jgi:hypothetical protein